MADRSNNRPRHWDSILRIACGDPRPEDIQAFDGMPPDCVQVRRFKATLRRREQERAAKAARQAERDRRPTLLDAIQFRDERPR